MLSQSAVQNYQQNSVYTADPLKLIVMAYDSAIASCRQRDLERSGRAIRELSNGLRMDVTPIAGNLLGLYQYCGELVRHKRYDEAVNILKELRDTWVAAGSKKRK